MKSSREPRPHYAIWLGILGFFLGVLFVLIATMVGIFTLGYPINWQGVVQLHQEVALMWLIDTLPIWSAILLAITGGRMNVVEIEQWRAAQAIHQRDAAIHGLKGELSSQEQARQQLDDTVGRGKREWEATFDTVDDMIIITDVGGRILRCNRATTHAFRAGFEELIGKKIEDLFFGGEYIMKFPGAPQKAEMRFPQLEGWYEVSTSPIVIEERRPATVYVIRDITDRKLAAIDLSRQKEYFEALVRNSPFAIVTLNMDQRVIASNPTFERLFGYKEQEVVGQELDDLIAPPDKTEEMQALTEAVKDGKMIHEIAVRQARDGSLVDVEVFGIPVVLWGKQIGMLALYHDISQLVSVGAVAEGEAIAEPVPGGDELMGEPAGGPESVGPALFEAAMPVGLLAALKRADSQRQEELVAEEAASPAGTLLDEEEVVRASEVAAEPSEEVPPTPRRRPTRIESIEGIGPVFAAKLAEVNIYSTEDLLIAGARRKGRVELGLQTGISAHLLLRWVNIADLMRVPGVGEQYSELLEAAGVDTVKELRRRKAENLHREMARVNEEKKLVRRPPYLSEVESWIEAAKHLEAVVEY